MAAAVFGLFAVAFALGAMGGGDVKLIAALALWLPFQAVIVLHFHHVARGRRADRWPCGSATGSPGAHEQSSKFLTGLRSHSAVCG